MAEEVLSGDKAKTFNTIWQNSSSQARFIIREVVLIRGEPLSSRSSTRGIGRAGRHPF
jgi:hypothetical protein